MPILDSGFKRERIKSTLTEIGNVEKKGFDGKNGKFNFKWVSERLGMPKRGRCEILTIGREVRGRGADKSEARRRVRVKGNMAVAYNSSWR